MTFSVLAFDRDTGETGAGIASCVPLDTLRQVYGAAPEHGALVTQSYLHDTANGVGVGLLANGASAEQVIAALTAPSFDDDHALRQYAVIDGAGETSAHTGSGANPFADHQSGRTDRFVFTVQGNFLSGEAVLERMAASASEPKACDLADAVVRALLAGAAEGGGDARCVALGFPAQSALVVLGNPEAPLLEIAVDGKSPPQVDPLQTLREQYELWRAEHPCPVPSESAASSSCALSEPTASSSWLVALALLCLLRASRGLNSASSRRTESRRSSPPRRRRL